MPMDLICNIILMLDAFVISVGLAEKKNMWVFIAFYWMFLVAKYFVNVAYMA